MNDEERMKKELEETPVKFELIRDKKGRIIAMIDLWKGEIQDVEIEDD